VIDFAEDSQVNLNGTTLGLQLGGTYEIAKGIAASLMAEENSNRFNRSQFRVIGMLDFAFNPEI
jgi:hypothetical protein